MIYYDHLFFSSLLISQILQIFLNLRFLTRFLLLLAQGARLYRYGKTREYTFGVWPNDAIPFLSRHSHTSYDILRIY